MAERETAIQNAAKKQMVDMEARFEGLGQKLEGAAQELAQVKHQATKHEDSLKKQIAKVPTLPFDANSWSPSSKEHCSSHCNALSGA